MKFHEKVYFQVNFNVFELKKRKRVEDPIRSFGTFSKVRILNLNTDLKIEKALDFLIFRLGFKKLLKIFEKALDFLKSFEEL